MTLGQQERLQFCLSSDKRPFAVVCDAIIRLPVCPLFKNITTIFTLSDKRPVAVAPGSPSLSCHHRHLDDDDLISVDLQRAAAAGEPDPVGGPADLQALPVAGAIQAAGQPGEGEQEGLNPADCWLSLLCVFLLSTTTATAAALGLLHGLVVRHSQSRRISPHTFDGNGCLLPASVSRGLDAHVIKLGRTSLLFRYK